MEYFRLLGGNFENNLRNFHLSQETGLKIAVAAVVVVLVVMMFTRVTKK